MNQLYRGMPLKLDSLTELQYLDLSANKLWSLILENIGNLLKLQYLNLSNNQFIQKIPIELEKLIPLSELNLSYNFLDVEIPFQICNMNSLERSNLCHNNHSNFNPRYFKGMHCLSRIDIYTLKKCTTCHASTYPIMSYRDQFLIAQHSNMLIWKETKDCVAMLKGCHLAKQSRCTNKLRERNGLLLCSLV